MAFHHVAMPVRTHTVSRFAFVEYESRRDADDAYHEMHNKRLGRDDVLKIEVRNSPMGQFFSSEANWLHSGPVRLLPHPGGLTPAVTHGVVTVVQAVVVIALLVAAQHLHLVVVEVTILLAKTIVANATTIGVTETALEAQTTETAK